MVNLDKSKNIIRNKDSLLSVKSPTPLFTFAVLLIFTMSLNSDWNQSRILWWGSVACLIASFAVTFRFDFRLGKEYTAWLVGFFINCLLSVFWALSQSYSINILKSMIVNIVILLVLYSGINSKENVKFFFKIFLIACLVNATYLLLTNLDMLMSLESADRLGNDSAWNANAIGMMTSICALLSVYFFQTSKTKSAKGIMIASLILMLVVSLLTGSRKAILILAVGISMYLFLSNKVKRVKTIVVIALFLFLIGYIVMKVPYFYSIIGWRIEAYISSLTGSGEVDGSTISRQKLITAAIDAWLDKPIIGHGIDCFRIFGMEATGKNYYAHNNYVELLADLGIIGFSIYYAGYAFILYRLIKNKNKSKFDYLLITIMTVILALDYACVSYSEVLFKMILMLEFAYVCKPNNERMSEIEK